MADPLTPNLQFAQPTAGSDIGAWATPMNNNTTILDNALGATATVALTNANVVLTATQYQSVFLVFTGALSGNVTITYPASFGGFNTVINNCTNSSAFSVTLITTQAGGQQIGCPFGEPFDILRDGLGNVKYRNLGRVGTYWDFCGSSVPTWVSNCTVAPYLNCDGTGFSSATYPVLTVILGSTTLPDMRGRYRAYLNQGTARITSGSSTGGVDGNTLAASGGVQTTVLSSQNMPLSPVADTHQHRINSRTIGDVGFQYQGSGNLGGTFDIGGLSGSQNFSTPVSTIGSIIVGSTSPTNVTNLPPTAIGGLTLIRAG